MNCKSGQKGKKISIIKIPVQSLRQLEVHTSYPSSDCTCFVHRTALMPPHSADYSIFSLSLVVHFADILLHIRLKNKDEDGGG